MLMQLITGSGEERRAFVDQLKKRGDEKDRRVEQTVAEILQNVRENGDRAVRAYTEKFDGRAPEQTEVSRKELEDCLQSCDPKFRRRCKTPPVISGLHDGKSSKAGSPRGKTERSWASGCGGCTGWAFMYPAAPQRIPVPF